MSDRLSEAADKIFEDSQKPRKNYDKSAFDVILGGTPEKPDLPDKTIVEVSKNFLALHLSIIDFMKLFKHTDFKVYLYMYRMSWGWRKTWCRVSYTQLEDNTGMARTTCSRSLDSLEDSKWIKILNNDKGRTAEYRVYLPVEREVMLGKPADLESAGIQYKHSETVSDEKKNDITFFYLKLRARKNKSPEQALSLTSSEFGVPFVKVKEIVEPTETNFQQS